MKIAIDISQVVYGTGVSTYTENLVRNLLRLDKHNEYILFAGALRRKEDLDRFVNNLKGRFQTSFFPIPPTLSDLLWNRIHFIPVEILIGKVDVFHSSDWTQPKSGSYTVTTIHDLIPIKYPEYSHPKIVDVGKKRFDHVFKEVKRIIVPSEETKKDVIGYGVEGSRLVVIPEAVDPRFKIIDSYHTNSVIKKYGINKKYLLSVGITPRKNTQRIVEAYRKLKKDYGLELVLVGHDYLGLQNEDGVKILGHVDKNDIPHLYANSEALVYPSLYEGFGLPILEAYASGVPVVTSDLGSMKEVGEGSSIMVDPYSVDSIRDGMVDALSEKVSLVKKGRLKLKNYSWEKTAAETLRVYNSL